MADVPADAPAECPGAESSKAGHSGACEGCPSQAACSSGETKAQMRDDTARIRERLGAERVRRKILVLSGKGGVGKSTFAAHLALAMASGGCGAESASSPVSDAPSPSAGEARGGGDVGLLDVDICGPSIAHMLSLQGEEVRQTASGWQPVYVHERLAVMSVSFLLGGRDDAVVWRGARKTALIRQFLGDVEWGELDTLLVDTPPGTSDEHISLLQLLRECGVDGALLVTTPQEVSLLDVRKEINFCKSAGLRVLGVVENMSGWACPHCAQVTDVFAPSSGGAQRMCAEMGVPLLGRVPLDPALAAAADAGRSVFDTAPNAPAVRAVRGIVSAVEAQLPCS